MNKKNVGIAFGALCGLAALTATAAEIFYDISINTKSPIHMSKLNNLVQKATNTDGNEEEASAKYSGMTGTPEIKEWYATHGEDVYILSDSLRLHGKRFKNTGTKYVLVCHGYTSKAKHMAGFVNKFYSLGYNVLAADARAHGDSEGTKIGMGWPERFDVIEWIKLIISWDSNAQIILHGVSMGAATVLMASGEELPENVKVIIADCGYTSPADIIKKVLSERNPFPAEFIMKTVNMLFIRPLAKIDVFSPGAEQALKGCRLPVLFIHGDADTFVPCEMTKRNFAACASEKELLIIKGADHALSFFSEKETVLNAVTGFLNKYIK